MVWRLGRSPTYPKDVIDPVQTLKKGNQFDITGRLRRVGRSEGGVAFAFTGRSGAVRGASKEAETHAAFETWGAVPGRVLFSF